MGLRAVLVPQVLVDWAQVAGLLLLRLPGVEGAQARQDTLGCRPRLPLPRRDWRRSNVAWKNW